MHPSSGITKEYVVTLNRQPRPQDLEAIAAGCTMDGVFVQPVAVIRDDSDSSRPNRVRVVVAEGRNREVRRGRGGGGGPRQLISGHRSISPAPCCDVT